MATTAMDFSALLKGIPEGAWVAISEQLQTVLAYSADLQKVIDIARDKGDHAPLILRVPERSSMLFL